jgi:hypothetical protein
VLTGGLGNWALATGELFGAVGLALVAIAAPLIALGLAILVVIIAYRIGRKILMARQRT